MRVAEVMSRNVRSVGAHEEIEIPADLARFGRFRALPVLDGNGRLVGMLSRSHLVGLATPQGGVRRFKVADLLRPNPAAADPDSEIDDAARLMLDRKASVLPVVDADGKLIGILTDADLAALLSGRRVPVREFEEIPVSQLMTAQPATIEEGATLEAAARMMLEGGYRHLPVVDEDGALVGMLSERQLREQLGTEMRELYHMAPEVTGELVGNIMTPDPLTVRADAKVIDALDLFGDERFTAMPVLDGTDKLVGILSYVDVLNWLRAQPRPFGEPTVPSAGP